MNQLFKTALTVALTVLCGTSINAQTYVETSISDLENGDVVLIVDKASGRSLSHTTTKKGPLANKVTISEGKINGDYSGEEWTVTIGTKTINGNTVDVYSFNGGKNLNLYNANDNAGVKVGTGGATKYIWSEVTVNNVKKGYLKSSANDRYLGVYTDANDWRCYTAATGNIASTETAFFKKESVATPIIDINADENNQKLEQVIYDMSGRRVSSMQPGRIYIVNGKKMMVK